jgi:hypothetical protein
MCYWLTQRGSLFVADWDESDAFCNVPREDTSALLGDIAPRLGTWLQRFYGNLRIRTATPHGLTDPFRMAHGGGQGDSGGVGAYLAVGVQRTRCHRGILLQHGNPGKPTEPLDAQRENFPAAPHDSGRAILEVAYSDDRRPLAFTGLGLEQLLNTMSHTCWAAGGSVNASKLRAFRLQLRDGRLVYAAGVVHPAVGTIRCTRGGLLLAGVPLVMGERATNLLQKVTRRLRAVRAGVMRLQPSYLLSVRIVLGYAVSQLDFVYSACPPAAAALETLQVLTDAILTYAQGAGALACSEFPFPAQPPAPAVTDVTLEQPAGTFFPSDPATGGRSSRAGLNTIAHAAPRRCTRMCSCDAHKPALKMPSG